MKLTEDLVLQFEERELLVPINDGDRVTASDIFIREAWSRITDHANKLLRDEMSRWPVVYSPDISDVKWSSHASSSDSHFSRIMPPQPIPKETAEDVLRDLIKAWDTPKESFFRMADYADNVSAAIERARKVLK